MPLAFSAFFFLVLNSTENNTEKVTKEEKNISERDSSITTVNSYSNLFLDSAALQNFITQNKIADSIARRLEVFIIPAITSLHGLAAMDLQNRPVVSGTCMIMLLLMIMIPSLKDKKLQKKMDRLIAEDELSVSAQIKIL